MAVSFRARKFNRGSNSLRYLRAILVTLLLVTCTSGTGHGQTEENATAPPKPSASRPGGAKSRSPEIYYLRDAAGNLVPVPGFQWEDFAKLYEIQQAEETVPEPAGAVIDRLQIGGRIVDERAELELRVDLTLHDDAWHAVPLRFDRAALREQQIDLGELRLEPAANGEGFLAWVKGSKPGAVQVTLKLLKEVERASGGKRLTLALPRAVRTVMSVQVPEANATAELGDGEGMISSSANASGSLLTGELVADTAHLCWRASMPAGEGPSGLLDATGKLNVQIDGDGITTAARVVVRSAGQPIESLEIELPLGAEWIPEQFPSYVVEPYEDEERRAVRVRLFEPNTIADVRLNCRQEWDAADRSIDVGGFAVVDAVRQRGHVAITVAEDVRAEWDERFLVRQVDELPADLRGESITAGFEYSGQPFSLITRVSPRVTRLTIEPQYLVQVTEEELLLSARLRCRVRGGKLHQLQLDLGDWTVDEAGWGSDGLIAVDDVLIDEPGPLTLPLLRAVEGEFEVRFQARRPVSEGATEVAFDLPRPVATLIAPAQLVVVADDNIRLTARSETEMQLVAQRADATVTLPPSRQPPLFYRGDVTQAKFQAASEVRASKLETTVRTHAAVASDRLDVEQVLSYHVENAPVDRLRLSVPAEITAIDSLRQRLYDDDPLSLALTAPQRSADGTIEVFLPEPCLGDFEIELRYGLPRPPATDSLQLPLVQPAHQAKVSNTLVLSSELPIAANVVGEPWTRDAARSAGTPNRWRSDVETSYAQLAIKPSAASETLQDMVDRAWTQTQLVNDIRQERVVWQVMAPDGVMTIRLPDGVLARDVMITLDGVAPVRTFEPSGNLIIALPAKADRDASHILELDYHLEGVSEGLHARLAPVRLVSPGWIKQTEWELLLPQQEHLLDSSGTYAREFSWTWQGLGWTREPFRTSADLQSWSGAASREAPPLPYNRYLLSTFGPPQELALRTASRSTLVMSASAIVLAVGFLFLFVPRVRRADGVLIVALALVTALTLGGDVAILLAQCALPGVLPLIVALAVQRMNRRQLPSVPRLQGSTHSATPPSTAPERPRGSSIISAPSSTRALPQPISSESL
jgi:hypothetical protein